MKLVETQFLLNACSLVMSCTKAMQCLTTLGLAEMSSTVCFQEMEVRVTPRG